MIKELSDLGKRLRSEETSGKLIHNALKDETHEIDLIINLDGSFDSFLTIPRVVTTAEAISAKKGKARLLLDKAEEVLCYSKAEAKHKLFLDKLDDFKHLEDLKPVLLFYWGNKVNGLDKAIISFETQVGEKQRIGNIAFRIVNEAIRIHEKPSVHQALILVYDEKMSEMLDESGKRCSLCGSSSYPIVDQPHGTINRVPDGLPAGNVLVSYNEKAFESYGLIGNINSSICTNCARTYVEGLKWLLNNGHEVQKEDKSGKLKSHFQFTNRKNFGLDTAMVFWTRENKTLDELDLLENPDGKQIGVLIDSITTGQSERVFAIDEDVFYSCTLSGAAARIAIRDWIEISLTTYKRNISQWFDDIAIFSFGQKYFASLYWLSKSGHNEKSKNDPSDSRIASALWGAALRQAIPPLWILGAVLKRTHHLSTPEEGKSPQDPITKERAALIRLIINRNIKGGRKKMSEKLDRDNLSPGYVCGQIFSVMVDIQKAAMGKDVNAGIRERFFSFASTTPAAAFGRLMQLSQYHLTKIKGEKPGISFILDRELQEMNAKITGSKYPSILTLEEQGEFALGYYHKKQETWEKAQAHKEFKEAISEGEEK